MDLDKLRETAQPGDIILLGNPSIIGSPIMLAQSFQTKDGQPSQYTHSVIYVSEDLCAESTIRFKPGITELLRVKNGTQYGKLSDYENYRYWLLLHFPFTEEQRDALLDKAQSLIDAEMTYPVDGLLGSLLSFYLFKSASNPLQSKNSLYCSAFVQEVYSVLGIDFDPNHTARNTSPEIISQYEMEGLVKIALVRKAS